MDLPLLSTLDLIKIQLNFTTLLESGWKVSPKIFICSPWYTINLTMGRARARQTTTRGQRCNKDLGKVRKASSQTDRRTENMGVIAEGKGMRLGPRRWTREKQGDRAKSNYQRAEEKDEGETNMKNGQSTKDIYGMYPNIETAGNNTRLRPLSDKQKQAAQKREI